MKVLIILLVLFLGTNLFGQDKFIIKDIVGQDGLNETINKVNPNNIFEDSLYIVSKTCRGEFGGTIKFKNKKTGIEYSAASTCPVVVNKLNGKYYITNTLDHMRGFSQILEIRNPKLMSVFKLPIPRSKKGKIIIMSFGDDQSKSTKGTNKLVDSLGILTLASFPYKGQLYHIVSDFKKTYLTKVENNRFITIDTVSDKNLWTSNPEVSRQQDGHMIIVFKNREVVGILDIFENQIIVKRKE
jgi:hypothetical protein